MYQYIDLLQQQHLNPYSHMFREWYNRNNVWDEVCVRDNAESCST